MKKIFLLSLVSATPAFAFLGSGGTNVSQEYACVSLDGVPIPQGSDMANRCCSNGQLVANAPDTCRAGFNTIGAAAGEGAAYSIGVAQNALSVAQNMNGASTDFNASDNSGGTTSGSGNGGSQGESSAIGSGGNGEFGGTSSGSASGTTSGAGSYAGNNGSGSGSGGSGSGSGSSGGLGSLGSGFGSGSGRSGSGLGGTSAGSGADTRLAYVHGSGDGANGANGANGFGSGGSGGVGMDKGMDELKLADDANRDPNALANGDEDGALGTAEDPADYFKRIDQSANIFKIVSARYMKKKSLFKVKP